MQTEKNYLFNIWVAVGFLLAAQFFLVNATSAHFLQSDGSIAITLHLEPDDDPIINQPAQLLFIVSDSKNQFNPANCDCRVEVSHDNQILLNQQLLEKNASSSVYAFSQSITFPKADGYQIKLIGQPKSASSFTPFQAVFNVSMKRMPGQPPSPDGTDILKSVLTPDPAPSFIIPTVAAAIFLAIFLLITWKKQQP